MILSRKKIHIYIYIYTSWDNNCVFVQEVSYLTCYYLISVPNSIKYVYKEYACLVRLCISTSKIIIIIIRINWENSNDGWVYFMSLTNVMFPSSLVIHKEAILFKEAQSIDDSQKVLPKCIINSHDCLSYKLICLEADFFF